MINIGIKKRIGDIEISMETSVENKERVKDELKELYELIQSSQKELSSEPDNLKTASHSKLSYMKG